MDKQECLKFSDTNMTEHLTLTLFVFFIGSKQTGDVHKQKKKIEFLLYKILAKI